MQYNNPETYKNLLIESDFYRSFKPLIREINELAIGGYYLNPQKYLLIRDSESEEITKKRVEKFAPKNYFGAALKYLLTNQATASLDVHTDTLIGNAEKWNNFLSAVTKSKKGFKEFVLQCFKSALIHKICFIQVELDFIDSPPDLNEAQLEEFLALDQRIPYLNEIYFEDVLTADLDEDKVNWIKFTSIEQLENPFKPTQYNLKIVLIDSEHITTWTFENVLFDESGGVYKIWDSRLNNGNGGYRKLDPEKDVAIPLSIPHNRGACPVIKFELPDDLWMANQVYLVQKVLYGLHMNLIHTAANCGFVQKSGEPWLGEMQSTGGGASYVPLPKEAIADIAQKYAKHLGDESLIFFRTFQFNEIQGTSLEAQANIINDLKNYVYTVISTNQSNVEPDQPTNMSGYAKEVDMSLQNAALKDHGIHIVKFSRAILQQVSRAFGVRNPSDLEKITVSGMDKFAIKPLSESLDIVERVFKLPAIALPPDLFVEVINQFSMTLLENSTYESKSLLKDDIISRIDSYLALSEDISKLQLNQQKTNKFNGTNKSEQ